MAVLSGKTALVTGAGKGIGREIALRLARDGAFVFVHYGKSREGAEAVLAEIQAEGGKGFVAGADLAKAGSVEALFAAIDGELARAGLHGIDILVNNAGIGMPRNMDDITPAEFDAVFTVNTKASLFVAQQAARRMGAGGRIINISSMVGNKAYGGFAIAYGASKAAIDYMTTAMAVHLGPRGITVNTIAPGATDTDFIGDAMKNEQMVAHLKAETALREIGDPRDIAKAVAMIASPDSKWITGERIRASGGTLL
jgi:3-oxoacyl-[acyl-carrier protein] reductase